MALYLASLLGAGLLALPAVAFSAAGPASLVSWVVLLVASVPVALTFTALGSSVPDSGGVAAYAHRAFGPGPGAWVGFCFILGLPFGAPATALVGAAYVARTAGWGQTGTLAVAVALLGLAAVSAVGGVRLAGGVQLGLAVVLVLVLLGAVLGALPHADGSNLRPWMPHGLGGIARAAGPLFFSFAGWEAVAPLAQEFPNPDADARAVAISTLVIVTIVYLALAITCVLTLGAGMDADSTPVQSLLALSWRGGVPWVTAVLAAILTYGAMSAYIGGAASMAAALARDGWLPRTLARGHEAGQTPRRAAAAVGAVAIVTLVLLHVTGVPLGQIMTLASAMFITVTLAGLLAGARLLASPWQRVSALIGGAMVLLVLVGCGSAAAGPLAVAVAVAVARRPLSRRRSSR